jgi:hypothetical protein
VLGRAVARIVLVPLGFLLGMTAALATLVTLGLERVTHSVHGRSWNEDSIEQLVDFFADAHGLINVATIVPAVLVVLVGEITRIRSALYYIAGGGVALAAWPLLQQAGGQGLEMARIGLGWPVFATAGFAGGLVYWVVAGRRA